MNRRVWSGSIAGLAAVLLATGGSTLGAFDDSADVPANTVGAGVLELDLSGGTGSSATLSFNGLEPGDHEIRRFWLVENDASSTVPGAVGMSLTNLVDTPASCSISRGKAIGDIASGIAGCVLTATGARGTPQTGVASRMLAFSIDAARGNSPTSCGALDPSGTSLLPSRRAGNLAALASTSARLRLVDPRGGPIVIAPGQGICVVIAADWPPDATDAAHASPRHPVDDAAQGDSMTVHVRFDLAQTS
jgi:hypothetical protein